MALIGGDGGIGRTWLAPERAHRDRLRGRVAGTGLAAGVVARHLITAGATTSTPGAPASDSATRRSARPPDAASALEHLTDSLAVATELAEVANQAHTLLTIAHARYRRTERWSTPAARCRCSRPSTGRWLAQEHSQVGQHDRARGAAGDLFAAHGERDGEADALSNPGRAPRRRAPRGRRPRRAGAGDPSRTRPPRAGAGSATTTARPTPSNSSATCTPTSARHRGAGRLAGGAVRPQHRAQEVTRLTALLPAP